MASLLATEDNKLVDDMSEFITNYIETQVHPEAPDDFKAMVGAVLLDGFEAGAQFADNVSGRDSKSIILL